MKYLKTKRQFLFKKKNQSKFYTWKNEKYPLQNKNTRGDIFVLVSKILQQNRELCDIYMRRCENHNTLM